MARQLHHLPSAVADPFAGDVDQVTYDAAYSPTLDGFDALRPALRLFFTHAAGQFVKTAQQVVGVGSELQKRAC
jgi:hypothetical protein